MREGHKVVVIAPIDEYINYKDQYPSVKHYSLRSLDRDSTNPLKDLILILELRRKYRKIKPDLVLHFTNKPNIFGGFAAALTKVNSIAVVTGLGYAFIHNGLIKKITKRLYAYSSPYHKKFIFENNSDRQLFTDLKLIASGQGTSVKGCGVDTNYYKPSPVKPDAAYVTFTFIGRLLYDKGIVEFVRVAEMIKKDYPKARFWVMGELDPENPSTINKDDLNRWMEDKTIEYLGFVSDVRPVIAKSDCIVLPSYREGLPRTVIEGLSMAKPIITTEAPGCEETVDEGSNGYLVSARSVESLHDAVRRFYLLPQEKKEKMGDAGRNKALREFDSTLIADQIYDIVAQYIK